MDLKRHWWPLVLIVLLVGIAYGGSVGSFFCGYDDFAEIQRAQFEDSQDPLRILTTTHFGTTKYRPVQRGLSYLTWAWGGHSATVFRLRNIAFHLAGAFSIYGIAWFLCGALRPALAAGLIFAVHPLAHQSVIVASWGVTAAYGFFFVSLCLFFFSLQSRRWPVLLAGSFLSLLLGLLTYEPVIVAFGIMGAYLILFGKRHQPYPRFYWTSLLIGCGCLLGCFVFMRLSFVAQQSAVTPLPTLVKNIVLFGGALALPMDTLLANTLWGTPLPPDIRLTSGLLLAVAAAILVLALAIFFALRRPAWRERVRTLDGWLLAFLVASGFGALLPYLVFTDHASETYLYSPVAFYSILVGVLLWKLTPPRAFSVLLGVLLVLFLSASLVRTQKVAACAATAETILQKLPVSEWKAGAWSIRLATTAQEPPLRRYGIYGFHGLASIDPREPGISSAEWAIRVASGNPLVTVQVVDTATMDQGCSSPDICYWVLPNGDVARR